MKTATQLYYRLKAKYREKEILRHKIPKKYAQTLKTYAGKELLSAEEINGYMYERIMSGEPFLAGRFGSTELLNIRSFDFGGFIGQKYDEDFHFNHLCEWSGFFPHDKSLLPRFVGEMKEAIRDVDVLAVWFHAFEDYYIKKAMKKDLKVTYLLDFEPWASKETHWSAALKGKKVLLIHPFENTIKKQYEKREELFPGTDILPEFELLTLKAVQTLAGTKDERFSSWFDALDWMSEEALKMDFDVAIIGCGAYGLPLAARLKKAGKQAIHLAGATQLLFGIKGKRWEENDAFLYVKERFNDAWVYPGDEDRLENGTNVEGGCYWK